MRSRRLYFIVGGFLLVWILSVYFYHVNAMASDLSDKIQIVIDENGHFSLLEEDKQNSSIILSDTFGNFETMNENDDYNDTVTENDTDLGGDSMQYDNYKIMVVFCFGLLTGVIVGHFLTGFIK